jgi:carboxypeptidase family protein/PEGA domain-containing protein
VTEVGLAARPGVPPSLGIETGVRGFVQDERGRAIAGAEVSIRVGERVDDPSGITYMEFPAPDAGKAITGPDGQYAIDFHGSGLVRVAATASGFDPAVNQVQVSAGRDARADLRLQWSRAAYLRGRLLDLAGRPLWPADVLFLFPQLDRLSRAAACAPDTDTTILTIGGPGGSNPIWIPAGISEEDATFHARLDPGWVGLVRLVFHGRTPAEAAWKEGDPPVDLRVDVPALRAGVGAVDLSILDAGGGGFVAGSRVRLTRENPDGDDWGECTLDGPNAPGPLRLADLPPGRYLLRVGAPGYAEVSREARVDTGSTTPIEVALPRPAVVRVRLVETEGVRPAGYGLAVLDEEGRELSCEVESSEDDKLFTVSGVPPGKGWLVINTNLVSLSVAEGSDSEIVVPIRRRRAVTLRVRYPGSTLGTGPMGSPEVRLLADGRIPIQEGWSGGAAVAGRGWWEYLSKVVPGTYTLEVRTPGRPNFRRELVVGEGESTEVVID